MVVGILRLELFLPAPQSLKGKRALVQKILGRCRERFSASCAETGAQDLWQRTELGFAVVGSDEASLHTIFHHIEEEIDRIGVGDITDRYVEFLHFK